MAEKMTTSERIKADKPLEIWQGVSPGMGRWTWKVWKFYKAPGKPLKIQRRNTMKDPYGRVFCSVQSDYTHGSWDMGDVYYKDILSCAVRTFREDDPDGGVIKAEDILTELFIEKNNV
jgi:hypothetical protein